MNSDTVVGSLVKVIWRPLAIVSLLVMTVGGALAQGEDPVESLKWERTGLGQLGSVANIEIPEGFRFTGRQGTRDLMTMLGNTLTEKELGTLAPETLEWFVVLEFSDVGYVKDDEVPDAGEVMKLFKKNQEIDNDRRRSAGLETLDVVGWAKEPFYNSDTKNLEWALELRDPTGLVSVNYVSKILGRRGVMEAVLVCDGTQLDEILPTFQDLLTGFNYKTGNSYAEFTKGDKVAEYGLVGLMVGGGAFAAGKMGLFAVVGKFLGKFWYFVVAALIGIKTWIGKLFSRRS